MTLDDALTELSSTSDAQRANELLAFILRNMCSAEGINVYLECAK